MITAAEARAAVRHPALPWVAPFAVFIAFLALQGVFPASAKLLLELRAGAVLLLLATVSRKVIPRRPSQPWASLLCGVAVFAIWVGPDVLWPGYRAHWLFQNPITGAAQSTIAADLRADHWFLALRAGASFLLVPVLEELFWRGWLMRRLLHHDFLSVPSGACTAGSFWTVAVLFASEHGPYWEVGLAAGAIYGWWLVRTRNLADCMLAHAVTNACLAGWVLARGAWQYWL